jgi:hypothetical protein
MDVDLEAPPTDLFYLPAPQTQNRQPTLNANIPLPSQPPKKQDIEYAVEAGLEAILRPGCSGSFAHDVGGEETVAYVAELRNSTSDKALLQDACDQIRRLVAEHFQVCEGRGGGVSIQTVHTVCV